MADTQPTSPDVAFVRRVLIVVAIGTVVLAVWTLSDVLLLLFGSVLVAVMLRAIADPLAKYLGVADRWALALAGVVVIGVLAAGVWFLGPELARQMRGVFDRLPAAFAKIAEALVSCRRAAGRIRRLPVPAQLSDSYGVSAEASV